MLNTKFVQCLVNVMLPVEPSSYSQVSAVQILRDAVSKKSRQAALNRNFLLLRKNVHRLSSWTQRKKMITQPKAEAWTCAVQIGALPTFASFAVTIVTNLASTAKRSTSILTQCICITDGRRSSALVNVWANNNKNDKHNTQTYATCSWWQKIWNSKYTIA